ncbi:MAG: carbon-nitrogen hydrolase family protein [Haloarculaceae archaeon]
MTTVAACQLPVADLDVETNLDRVRERVAALDDEIAVAVFPEQTLTGFVGDDRIHEAAVRTDGPVVAALRDLAAGADVALLVGYVEDAGDAYYNAAAYVQPDGDVAVYRKRHLWADEVDVLTPGEDLVTVETPAGEAGLMTCYDLNFVADSAALTRERVNALFVVGAWPAAYSENWTLLVRSRALDGVRWVVGAGRTGRREVADARTVEYAGRSLVARPDGSVGHQLDRSVDDLVVDLDRGVLAAQRDLVGVYDD